MHTADVLVEVPFVNGTVATRRTFEWSIVDVTIAKVLGEGSRRWTRHITHGTLEAIHMGVHVIVE